MKRLIGAALIAMLPAAAAHAADPTPAEVEAGYISTCSDGKAEKKAACACAYPKLVAATEPDDVPFYVSAWAISQDKAGEIKKRHAEGWPAEATKRYLAAEKAALAECAG
jgi:hypothetical protein